MAIVQASMAEEILNRSERAIIRGIYRASQLAEAKTSLIKAMLAVQSSKGDAVTAVPSSLDEHSKSLMTYLDHAISNALVSTKVPALRKTDSDNPSPSA